MAAFVGAKSLFHEETKGAPGPWSHWLGRLGSRATWLEAALASPGTRSSSILKRKNTGETGCGARGAGGVVWG